MGNYILIKNDELYHFGILGMKWGIRRYQNKDGSLTNLGRKRLGKDATKLGELKSEIAKNAKSAYAFRKSPSFASDYENKKTENEKKYNELHDEMIKKYGEQNIKDLDSIPEFKNAAHLGEIYTKELSEMIERQNFFDSYSNMTSNEIKDYLINEDIFNPTEDSKKDPKRANKIAKFGLEVLKDMDGRTSDIDPNDKGWKQWFMYEDQTIGYPQIADMALRGKNLWDIKKTIAIANNHYHSDEYDAFDKTDDGKKLANAAFNLSEGYGLEDYAKKCIDYMDWYDKDHRD